MPRNLDMTALRSFVAVAETGGVTRAAGQLHLTQSAVSMQLKRLEESLGVALMDRSARQIGLTRQGELLLSYGRRLLAMNDECWGRLNDDAFVGELVFGVPHDIIYPHIPQILRQFSAEFPKVNVRLVSSYTSSLKEDFYAGKADIILTTETGGGEGGETLKELPLIWVGAKDGRAWRRRPLRLASHRACAFRPISQAALDGANIVWEMGVDTDSSETVEASLSADLAVEGRLSGGLPSALEQINHEGSLPPLPTFKVNMYVASETSAPLATHLGDLLRRVYS